VRKPSEGWLTRDGVSLHYLEWAADSGSALEPPILFLHGLSSNARYWERVAGHLTGRRLIALDQRGHGLSGRPPHSPRLPEGYDMKELVEDVRFVGASLGLDGPVVVGHSWGATIALEVVGSRPGLASALVFIDGPVQSASGLFSWEEAQQIMQPPLPRFASLAAAVEASRSDLEQAWGEDLEPFVSARVMPDGDELILTLTGPVRYELLKGLYESKPELLWSRIDVPSAVLLALRSFARTAQFKESAVRQLSEIAPDVETSWFDTPHDIPLFMPSEIAAEIERIARLAAASGRSEASAG